MVGEIIAWDFVRVDGAVDFISVVVALTLQNSLHKMANTNPALAWLEH
jgi:hypothetical protein